MSIGPDAPGETVGPDWLLRVSRQVISLMGLQGRAARPLVGVQGSAVVLLVPAPGAEQEARMDEVARAVQRKVGQLVAPRAVSVVIGATVDRLEEYATAYRVARSAADLLRGGRRGQVVDVRELGVYALLLETGAPTGLRRIEQLLGCSLRHQETLLQLQLALTVRDVEGPH
ncbi:MAG: hypothetical protein GEV09_26660 [Pseudonocardiaceae bacterium]|nr:hypothetical protein [Pseudonocardiaceae bacterium]